MTGVDILQLEGVSILWCAWWDGPETGIAEYQGRLAWFAAVFDEATDDYVFPRCYVLYTLTESQQDNEQRRHRFADEIWKPGWLCFHSQTPNYQRFSLDEQVRAIRKYRAVYPDGSDTGRVASYRANPIIGWFMPSPEQWRSWWMRQRAAM